MKRLGALLVDLGWIVTEQLEHALQMQEVLGGRLGTNLLDLGALSEERLQTALGHQLRLPPVRPRDLRVIPREVRRLVSAESARSFGVVPFRMLGDELHVAFVEVSETALRELAAHAGKRIRPYVGNQARMSCALADHFGGEVEPRLRQLVSRLDAEESAAADASPSPLPPASPTAAPAAPREPKLAQWRRRLERLDDRDRIARAVLDVLAPQFRRVVLYKLAKGSARGWLGAGPGVDTSALRRLRVDLRQPSVLFNLAARGGHHFGVLPPMPAHEEMARAWGGGLPGDCVVLGIRVQGRLVCAILAEPGYAGSTADHRDLTVPDLIEIGEAAGDAFTRCVIERRGRSETPRRVPSGAARSPASNPPRVGGDAGARR